MAELLIRVNVDGATKIDELSAKLKNVDNSANAVGGKSLPQVNNSVKGLMGSFGGLIPVLAAVGFADMAKQAVELADTYRLMQGRLSLVSGTTNELVTAQNSLFQIAQESRVSFESTVDLYSRIARSTQSLGVSQQDLLSVTETINKSFIISGASAEASNAAIIQLGQAFASGTLRGDELNSVLEQSPRLAEAIARGMGTTVGQLRALGAEGKITSEQVFNALKSQGDAIDSEFGRMPKTVGQSMTQIGNSLLSLVGEMDQASGASSSFGSVLSGLAGILDDATDSLKKFNSQLDRVQDVRKVKTFEQINQSIIEAENKIKSLTTSTDLGDRISRTLQSSEQINAEIITQKAILTALNTKAIQLANLETKAEEEKSKKIDHTISKTKAQIAEEKKLQKEREAAAKKAAEANTSLDDMKYKATHTAYENEVKDIEDRVAKEIKAGASVAKAKETEIALKAALDRKYQEQNDQLQVEFDEKAKQRIKDRADEYEQQLQMMLDAEQRYSDEMSSLILSRYDLETKRIEDNAQKYRDEGRTEEEVNDYLHAANMKRIQDALGGSLSYMDATTNAVKGLEDQLVNAFIHGKFQAKDMMNSILADLMRIQVRNYITAPLLNWMSPSASANGNIFSGGNIQAFASGGAFTNSIVDQPTLAPMALFGEAGAEAIMPLTRDASGKLGVSVNGQQGLQNVKVEIVNQSGEQIQATSSQAKFDGEQYVINVVLDAVRRNRGGMRDVLGSR